MVGIGVRWERICEGISRTSKANSISQRLTSLASLNRPALPPPSQLLPRHLPLLSNGELLHANITLLKTQ